MYNSFYKRFIVSGIFMIIIIPVFSQIPIVENVNFEQRTDGSLLVDIYYDVLTTSNLPLEIIVEASDDGGSTWNLPCTSLSGDVGEGIIAGTGNHIVWDFFADNPNTSGFDYQISISAHCMVCGQTIIEDFTLTRDLNCPADPAPVINIGAPGITLDLGGHTIRGEFFNGLREYIIAQDVNQITIRNGTLDGFINGIILANSEKSLVENMLIKNLEIMDPEQGVSGIIISGSDSVIIQDSQFEFLFTAHKEAVINGNSYVTVRNITTYNGSVGVNFGGTVESKRPTGSVINCQFNNSSLDGVLVQQTDSMLISNNEFINSSISLDAAIIGIVSGVHIDGNDLHDRPDGNAIQFIGGIGSTVSNNLIRNSVMGISLFPSRGCGPDSLIGAECSYATGNLIINNTVLESSIDLFHDEKCLGNTWENNFYETAVGSEIFDVGPSTAKKGFTSVDSAATSHYADAQFLELYAENIDTLGRALKWIYTYYSESQQEYISLWYRDHRVVYRGTMLDPPSGDPLPIIDSWIDSDSALVNTDSMGGKEFRNEFEIQNIIMGLGESVWYVNYIAQDSVFRVEVNATMN